MQERTEAVQREGKKGETEQGLFLQQSPTSYNISLRVTTLRSSEPYTRKTNFAIQLQLAVQLLIFFLPTTCILLAAFFLWKWAPLQRMLCDSPLLLFTACQGSYLSFVVLSHSLPSKLSNSLARQRVRFSLV